MSFEKPHALIYVKDGFYAYHADSENWNAQSNAWEKGINRDLSVLLYLNDDFSGGELSFPNFNFKIKPKKGMLVCFPSDHRYVHRAEVTTEGSRYVVVSWAKSKNSTLVSNAPVTTSITI